MELFRKLGLKEHTLRVLKEMGFQKPTEIQEKSIPLAIQGKDVIGSAATGSGKTLAFGAAIFEKVKAKQGLQALILVPTRELAEQVSKALAQFLRYQPLTIASVFGGVGIEPQVRMLSYAEIAVATPGRILDHIGRNTINLSRIKVLVLDEADRMLDMGFIPDVERIISKCPKERQTLLFSATMSQTIKSLAHNYMKEPQHIAAEAYLDVTKLKHIYYPVKQNEKLTLLIHLLKSEHSKLVMVFCNTRKTADFVWKNLRGTGIESMALHGGMPQGRRTRIMSDFHRGRAFVLICTDVAARGLDIQNVSHVYNYDIPKTSEEYIHRVGRTARAGKEGKAVSILSDRDHDNFRNVLSDKSLKIERLDLPKMAPFRAKMFEEKREFGRGPRRQGMRPQSGSSPARHGQHLARRNQSHNTQSSQSTSRFEW